MKTRNIIMTIALGAVLSGGLTACQENEYGVVDLTMPDDNTNVDATYTFTHTGMFAAEDFARVKQGIANGTAPQAVKDAYQGLLTSKYASLSYTANPTEKIVRGDATGTGYSSENYANAMRDAAAAYQTAMLWKLTDNDDYANKAIEIMNAWARTCKEITSNDANQVLAAGAQGYTFALAADMLQSYSGWSAADKADFKSWMLNVFASKNRNFLDTHTGSNVCAEHYWSNWDLVNMASYMAIGQLTENSEMINYVVNYFYSGAGNGNINLLAPAFHMDPLGSGEQIAQDQESGRDQGHAQMSTMVAGNLAQIAYNLYLSNPSVSQLDFFAANDNALLAMANYVALSNLRNGTDNANKEGQWIVQATAMPFQQYIYCIGCTCRDQNHGATHIGMADDTGRGGVRPGWEIFLNHYKNVKGLTSGYTYINQMATKLRPELGAGDTGRYGDNSGAFDQLGFGTLMLYKE